jgi:CubicO group peptidase (beta-lactamase class C family)
VTKSFTSALIGIAIDKGHIESIDQKVLDFFPEYTPDVHDPLKRGMTIRHLLTMTAGFRWRTGARAQEQLVDRLRRSPDWVKFILDLPTEARSVGKFRYNSAASHLLSAIITRATGQCAEDFAAEHLFAPIGMRLPDPERQHTFSRGDVFLSRAGGWPKDPQGNSTGGWGMVLRPRDMARFGYLYLNRGRWDGAQIIPETWVADSITMHTPGYGYQWWLREMNGVFVFSADGRGGHHIFVVPEKDLVVVVASKQVGRWRNRLPLMEEYVLPGVVE